MKEVVDLESLMTEFGKEMWLEHFCLFTAPPSEKVEILR